MRCLLALLFLVSVGGVVGASMYLGLEAPEKRTPFEQFMYDPGMAIVSGVLFALWIGVPILIAVRRRRREAAMWAELAGSYGLEHEHPGSWGDGERLKGEWRGRQVELSTHVTSSRSSALSSTSASSGSSALYQTWAVSLEGLPAGLRVLPRLQLPELGRRFMAAAQQLMGVDADARSASSGDAELDERVTIEVDGEQALRAWLTPARRQVLLDLLREDDRYRVDEGQLRHVRQDRSPDLAELEAILARLEQAASRLEAG